MIDGHATGQKKGRGVMLNKDIVIDQTISMGVSCLSPISSILNSI